MTTTMNTGAASLSDERERAAITACALMIKGICLTRPNAEWTGAIEDRIQFMLKQMQAGAAIAAGGAQEAVAWKVDGLNGYNESAPSVWLKKDNAEAAAARLFKSSITPLAGPLPREAATVAPEVIAWRDAYQAYVDATAQYNSHLEYVRAHCPFGTSVDAQYQAMNEAQRKAFALLKPMHAALMAAASNGEQA